MFKVIVPIVFVVMLGACSRNNSQEPQGEPALGIIGGVPISGGEIESVGALVYTEETSDGGLVIPAAENNKICSAALIAPRVVLTAKHCASIFISRKFGENFANSAFVLGRDAFHPTSTYPIVDGVTDITASGSDLGFLYLAKPVTETKPLSLANYETLVNQVPLGNSFTVIGYGVQNAFGKRGSRLAGSMTLQGISGAVFQLVFSSFEGFLGAIPQSPSLLDMTGDITTPTGLTKARKLYSETRLIPGLQVLLVPEADQAMTCYGDSGGPLLRKLGNQITLFGVSSWGLTRKGSGCGYLAVEATFGKNDSATWLFTQRARDYIPCQSERIAGRCDGTKLIRCSDPGEGAVRTLKHDCADEGLGCSMVPASIQFGQTEPGTELDYGVRAECAAPTMLR